MEQLLLSNKTIAENLFSKPKYPNFYFHLDSYQPWRHIPVLIDNRNLLKFPKLKPVAFWYKETEKYFRIIANTSLEIITRLLNDQMGYSLRDNNEKPVFEKNEPL